MGDGDTARRLAATDRKRHHLFTYRLFSPRPGRAMVETMEDVNDVVDRARYGNGEHDLVNLVVIPDALRVGGLTRALDWYDLETIETAAANGRQWGARRVADSLSEAATIRRTCHGPELDEAITAFDRRHRAVTLDADLRAALADRADDHQPEIHQQGG